MGYDVSKEESLKQLQSNQEYGLSDAEVKRRIQIYGYNDLFVHKGKGMITLVKEQILDPMVIILFISAILSIVMMCFMDNYDVDTLGLLLTFAFLTPLLPFSIFSHPKFNKRNPFFGVKTLFTLSSDEAWYKVNSVASIAMFIGCLSVYALYFILFDLGIDVRLLGIFIFLKERQYENASGSIFSILSALYFVFLVN